MLSIEKIKKDMIFCFGKECLFIKENKGKIYGIKEFKEIFEKIEKEINK